MSRAVATPNKQFVEISFDNFVEINLEETPEAHIVFEKNLDPKRMVAELSAIMHQPIKPGKTLLFIDEIQVIPRAITALRYFYEKMPKLHVIAAGSLLDFAIEQVGIPVGRVQSLYMFLAILVLRAACRQGQDNHPKGRVLCCAAQGLSLF